MDYAAVHAIPTTVNQPFERGQERGYASPCTPPCEAMEEDAADGAKFGEFGVPRAAVARDVRDFCDRTVCHPDDQCEHVAGWGAACDGSL